MQTGKKPNSTYFVIDGVKLGEDDAIDQTGLVGHGVVRQGLIKLNLRTWTSTLDHTALHVKTIKKYEKLLKKNKNSLESN